MEAITLNAGSVMHGTYRLIRELGKGGMGAVWEAEHLRLPKLVAIKFLHGAGDANYELIARFRREAEIASRLGHPNIVEVHDFNTLPDGTPYLVMERLRGRDLRARLAAGPVPLDEARIIARQVASALAVAHREGVVHRDLKPENIFMCDEADGSTRVKILDFGISKIQGAATFATRDDLILGTPGYMAPEQAMGKNSSIDGRTDLFALAAIFYEMVTGQSVFLGETLAEVVYKVVYHTPEPLSRVTPSVPPGISTAVERALSKDPLQRQESMQAFADALLEGAPDLGGQLSAPQPSGPIDAMAGTVMAPTPKPTAVPTEHTARKGPWRFVAIGAVIALMALIPLIVLLRARYDVKPGADSHQPRSTVPPPKPPVASAQGSARASDPLPTAPKPDEGTIAPPPAPDTTAEEGDDTPPAHAAHQGSRSPQAKAPELPAAVREKLDQADAALASKDFARAVQLARTSLYEAKSARAYAIMAQAYCGQRDVGMAAAMLRNLQGAESRRVRGYCQNLGLTLAK